MVILTINLKHSEIIKPPPAFTKKHAAKYLSRGFEALMASDFNEAGACEFDTEIYTKARRRAFLGRTYCS